MDFIHRSVLDDGSSEFLAATTLEPNPVARNTAEMPPARQSNAPRWPSMAVEPYSEVESQRDHHLLKCTPRHFYIDGSIVSMRCCDYRSLCSIN